MKNFNRYVLLISIIVLSVTGCKNPNESSKNDSEIIEKIIPENLKWSERMMLSEIERFTGMFKSV